MIDKTLTAEEKIAIIKSIIIKEEIHCAEDLWQVDRINEDLPIIMEKICDIIGWCPIIE